MQFDNKELGGKGGNCVRRCHAKKRLLVFCFIYLCYLVETGICIKLDVDWLVSAPKKEKKRGRPKGALPVKEAGKGQMSYTSLVGGDTSVLQNLGPPCSSRATDEKTIGGLGFSCFSGLPAQHMIWCSRVTPLFPGFRFLRFIWSSFAFPASGAWHEGNQ